MSPVRAFRICAAVGGIARCGVRGVRKEDLLMLIDERVLSEGIFEDGQNGSGGFYPETYI